MWETLIPAIVGGTLTGAATIIGQRLQADRERRHRLDEARIEFQRRTLLEVQDALEILLASSSELEFSFRQGTPPDASTRRTLVMKASRAWVLAQRVEDPIIRDNIRTATTAATDLATIDVSGKAFPLFAATSAGFHRANGRIGELIRGDLPALPARGPRWWSRLRLR